MAFFGFVLVKYSRTFIERLSQARGPTLAEIVYEISKST